jgi:ribosomal protein S27AE
MKIETRICPKCGSNDVILGHGGVLRVPDSVLTNDPEWFCKKCNHVASIFPIKSKIRRKK